MQPRKGSSDHPDSLTGGSKTSEKETGQGCAHPRGYSAPGRSQWIKKGIENRRDNALLDTEGTVTVSTDHTSGSSLESQNAALQGFAIQNYGEALDKAQAAVGQYVDTSAVTPLPDPEMLGQNGEQSESPPESDAQPLDGNTAGPTIGSDEDAIEFRVIRSGAPVRRLRLTGNRYTFGSAEGCSIRLSDTALRPMHAVLIRDASRVLVRAYSVPIEINGIRTTEAALKIGDTLRLGAYQFELLSNSQQKNITPLDTSFPGDPFSSTSFLSGMGSIPDASAGPLDSSPPSDPTQPIKKPVRSESQSSSPLSEARIKLPATEDVIWRERLRREVEQWRERQQQCDRRENRCEERELDLRNRETELWSRAENLYRREARIQSQEASTLQLYDDFTQRQHELIKLREEVQSRQEDFNRREAEFRGQEFEYRRRLDEATRQLQQSHRQAETATQAVKRMREQFESLNSQIEELSSQEQQMETREQREREERERLRGELETARDQAIDAQAESEARRCEAEARVAQMATQIESLKQGQGKDLLEQQAQLVESERVAQQLREQVADLQKSVAEASEESSRLRSDYEGACESVRQLESLVAQSNERGDQDRESWAVEADELRSAVDQLSVELARANGELSDLREANAAMSARLDDVQRERDEARQDAESRPTNEEFQTLKAELDAANDQLSQMKCEYDQTLARLSEIEAARAAEPEPVWQSDEQQAVSPAPAVPVEADDADEHKVDDQTEQSESLQSPEVIEPVWSTAPPTGVEQTASDEQIPEAMDSQDESLTPESNYQTSEPAEVESLPESSPWSDAESAAETLAATEALETVEVQEAAETPEATGDSSGSTWPSEALADDVEQAEPEPAPSADAATGNEWPEAEPQTEAGLDQEAEPSLESQWNGKPEAGGQDYSPEMTSVWDGAGHELETVGEDEPNLSDVWSQDQDDANANDSDADNSSMVDGSLASMLIKDLENERVDDAPPTDGTYLMSDEPTSSWGRQAQNTGWDREHAEESRESEWANDPDGYRVEHVAGLQDEAPVDEAPVDEAPVEEAPVEGVTAGPEHACDEPQADTEGDFSTDSDPSASYEESETETEPESLDSESASEEELDDDDSIEAYMNRLLNRSQSDADSSSSEPETVSLSSSRLTKSVSLSDDADAAGDDVRPISPDEPLVPRSQAPETNLGLDAMRELANASARSAITRSVRIQTRDTQIKGAINFACAGGASACGIACILFLPGIVGYLAVAMTVIVAVIYIMQGMQEFKEASRQMKAAEKGLLEDEDEDEEGEEQEPAAENELAEIAE